jgi:hypothetical protein
MANKYTAEVLEKAEMEPTPRNKILAMKAFLADNPIIQGLLRVAPVLAPKLLQYAHSKLMKNRHYKKYIGETGLADTAISRMSQYLGRG